MWNLFAQKISLLLIALTLVGSTAIAKNAHDIAGSKDTSGINEMVRLKEHLHQLTDIKHQDQRELAIIEVIRFVERFEVSENPATRKTEFGHLIDLLLQTLRPEGASIDIRWAHDSGFVVPQMVWFAAQDYPADFTEVLGSRSAKERHRVQEALAKAEVLLETGNGG